jgi:hypothetical protein
MTSLPANLVVPIPFGAFDQAPVWSRADLNGLLQESEEKLAPMPRGPAVEPECELVQVGVQMAARCAALMHPQEPPLEQGGHTMNAGQQAGCRPTAPAHHPWLVAISPLVQTAVRPEAVRNDCGSGFHRLFDKSLQALCRIVCHTAQADASHSSSAGLGRNAHQGFVAQVAPTPASLLDTAHLDFVHFDPSGQSLAPGTDHGPSKFVQAHPSRFVTAQSQRTLQTQRIHPGLLVGYPPDCAKPRPQRQMAVLEDRPSGNADYMSTLLTDQPTSRVLPRGSVTTLLTPKPLRPPQPPEVVRTGGFGPEILLELLQSAWISTHLPVHYPLG